MLTKDFADGLVDAIISRIEDNASSLGNPVVLEWSEDVSVVENLPAIYVVPMVGKAKAIQAQGSDDEKVSIPVTIAGYYNPDDNDDSDVRVSMRVIRDYGFDCGDLFRGDAAEVRFTDGTQYAGAICTEKTVENAYWGIVDRVIHVFTITMVFVGYCPA